MALPLTWTLAASLVAATLPQAQGDALRAWHDALGAPRAKETFGAYVSRAALLQLGKTYVDPPDPVGPESLQVDLTTFECLTFVESTLAVARCGWRGDGSEGCFTNELEASRYRGGALVDFASRLHYFHEWLDDNAERGRIEARTENLGGVRFPYPFDFISKHAGRYPAMSTPSVASTIAAIEARLSERGLVMVGRDRLASIMPELRDGDLVGFVGSKPGLGITHVGFVSRDKGGPRLVHASSHHGKVLLTTRDVASYVLRRPERQGVVVARPMPPAPADPGAAIQATR